MSASQPPVQLFSEPSHYRREDRSLLADILRPFWKEGDFSDAQRRAMYGLSADDFRLVPTVDQADIAVLPMAWNYYVSRQESSRAIEFIQSVRRAGRAVLSYVSGDEGVAVPAGYEDVWVVRASGLRSRRRQRQVAPPVFFEDPWAVHPDLARFIEQPGQVPRVGFCGQASLSWAKAAWDFGRNCFRKVACWLRVRTEEAQPLYPPAWLRARALRVLAQGPGLDARFLIRTRYRAGADAGGDRKRTSREFYENVAETDYTLSVRGGGNFSKRFYETLAMGRIPVLVDTDCLLPFEQTIPWPELIVRVPSSQLDTLPQRVVGHYRANHSKLRILQQKCRETWQEFLTFGAFHRRLARLILDRP